MSYNDSIAVQNKLDDIMDILENRDYYLAWDSLYYKTFADNYMGEMISTVIWSNYSSSPNAIPHVEFLAELYLANLPSVKSIFEPYCFHADFCGMVINYLRFNSHEIIPFANCATTLHSDCLPGTCAPFNEAEFYNNFDDAYALGVSI